ncbi:uncharacterized protein PHACADRAFT_108524 [Phanerochaete carnosa HHB-10118-sp]|uniref:HAT C-terminal dimerisation domain-containing protein n=1 Tax=Phanerochaete carnosa (strain HHB-10118-sp) TaxID=650164 RepID=K5VPK1_PHACS|nr:uncharacterized protein PHACADRAFT_108524 [Phanerochaete carnosa HHB-10118-sp]EKM48650.1 hypothetical protein PHACADRAFT_108524 [Phanerochaete carnosa HHB-10118-sp]
MARTLALLLLKRYSIHFNPENGQIRCIAHVVNLVVQKILHELSEADDPALRDYYEEFAKHEPFHYNPEEDGDLKALEAEDEELDDGEDSSDSEDDDEFEDEDLGDLGQSTWKVQSPVKKLRLICTKIASSPQRRSRFYKIKRKVYKADTAENARRRRLMVIRDVVTRWNYTHAMIVRALELRDVTILNLHQQVFTKVTEAMSVARTPTLPYVLPMYEYMRQSLDANAQDEKLDPLIRNAAAAGLLKLLGYYTKAKASQYVIIATVLHPSMRLQWFNRLGTDFVEKARALFQHAYDEYAAAAEENARQEPEKPRASESQNKTGFLDEVCAVLQPSQATVASVLRRNEAEQYLAGEGGAVEPHSTILTWWKVSCPCFCTNLVTDSNSLGARRCISHHKPYGARLSGHSRNKRVSGTTVFGVSTLVYRSSLLFPGTDCHRGYVRQAMDSRRPSGSYSGTILKEKVIVHINCLFTVYKLFINVYNRLLCVYKKILNVN